MYPLREAALEDDEEEEEEEDDDEESEGRGPKRNQWMDLRR